MYACARNIYTGIYILPRTHTHVCEALARPMCPMRWAGTEMGLECHGNPPRTRRRTVAFSISYWQAIVELLANDLQTIGKQLKIDT